MLIESIQERESNKGVQKELMDSMKLIWSSRSWSNYLYWHKVAKNIMKRIDELIRRSMHTPFERIGTPEMLKGDLQGYWSRRITSEDRYI
jgi:toxin YoeB